jgi:hypothetical protein
LGATLRAQKIKRPFRRIGTASYESVLIGTLFGLRLCASSSGTRAMYAVVLCAYRLRAVAVRAALSSIVPDNRAAKQLFGSNA